MGVLSYDRTFKQTNRDFYFTNINTRAKYVLRANLYISNTFISSLSAGGLFKENVKKREKKLYYIYLKKQGFAITILALNSEIRHFKSFSNFRGFFSSNKCIFKNDKFCHVSCLKKFGHDRFFRLLIQSNWQTSKVYI